MDFFGNIIDSDDCSVNDEVFAQLDEFSGPDMVERFAFCCNAELSQFNSRFLQPGTGVIDLNVVKT